MKDNKVLNVLVNWDLIVAGAMLCVLVVCTFAGAIARAMSSPFIWLEELQLFCQVWIVFCGGCAAFRNLAHVEVEFIAELLPEKGQKAVLVINTVIITLVLGYLFMNSLDYLQSFMSSGRTTNVLNLSYVLIYGIAPVAVVFMLLNYYATLKQQWSAIQERCALKSSEKEVTS